jgi:hypothetical protein
MRGRDQVEVCVVVHDDGVMSKGSCREQDVHRADRAVGAWVWS